MKLTELLLNRFLYKEALQNLETKDSSYNAGNVVEETPPPLASGGAAQDINISNVTINPTNLTPGIPLPPGLLDIANWGWSQTLVFSSTNLNTVIWTATPPNNSFFKSSSGTTYTIASGTTGVMTDKTYIYFDLNIAPVAGVYSYQITTTPGTAVGLGKVLVAVAQNAAVASPQPNATYNLSEATQIVGDNILANSINASKIITGQLIVGTNVGLGTAQDSSGVTTIIGNTVNTGYLNARAITVLGTVTAGNVDALNVVAGSVAAENITGTYITGKTIRTASSGTRIVIDGGANEIDIYNGSTLRAQGYQNGWNYFNSSGTEIGTIYANGADFLLAADLTSTGSMYYGCGPSGSHSMHVGTGASTTRFYVDDTQMWLGDVDNFGFDVDVFGELKLNNGLFMDFAGSISSGGVATGGTNAGSVAVDNSTTGVYIITHYMGTANFTVLITLRSSTAVLLATVSQKSSSTFTVRIGNVAGTLTNAAFDFACFKWN